MNNRKDTGKQSLLARTAWLYYKEELTQAEIGERLGISRVSVNRLLKEARQSGVVEINIQADLIGDFPLRSELRAAYGLTDVLLAPQVGQGEELYRALAQVAAQLLAERISPGKTIGFGSGRTLSYVPEYFQPSLPTSCALISLTGNIYPEPIGNEPADLISQVNNFDVVNRLAHNCGGQALYIPSPTLVSSLEAKNVFLKDATIQRFLNIARTCQLAMVSAGPVDPSSLLFQSGLLTAQDLAELQQHRAVGDLLARFFDENGLELVTPINQRVIGLSIEELKNIPTVVLVAGGENKRRAIHALLCNQVLDILVTDLDSAHWLLEKSVSI